MFHINNVHKSLYSKDVQMYIDVHVSCTSVIGKLVCTKILSFKVFNMVSILNGTCRFYMGYLN